MGQVRGIRITKRLANLESEEESSDEEKQEVVASKVSMKVEEKEERVMVASLSLRGENPLVAVVEHETHGHSFQFEGTTSIGRNKEGWFCQVQPPTLARMP